MANAYTRDPSRVDKALRQKGIVVVMARDYARNPEDVVNTIQAIYDYRGIQKKASAPPS